MRIDTSTIENYENMTAEEKVAALEGLDVKDTDTENHYKDLISRANSEAKKYKDAAREANDKLRSQMSEEEQKATELADHYKTLEEENARLKKDALIAQKTTFYQSIGFSAELAKDTAEAFAEGDFAKVEKNQITAHAEFEKNLRADVFRQNPQPENSGSGTQPETITLEEAMRRANEGENINDLLAKVK